MSFPEEFCQTYQPHPNVEKFIEGTEQDPDRTFEAFYQDYRDWIQFGRPPDNMGFFFQSTGDSRRALALGDGNAEGRVVSDDCRAFVDFVNQGEAALTRIAPLTPQGEEEFLSARTGLGFGFEDAVLAYLVSDELPDYERSYLNGACFLRNEMKNTNLPGGKVADIKEFYAIPGRDMLLRFSRDISGGLWKIAHDSFNEAAEIADMRMINLDLAMQLRLGKEGEPIYPPKTIGSGFVIFGAR
ncbi:hypothetical protein [uncultured Roseobacter sp.]|uniref:hypothetical protein n=1 Tax=uncultured Roseobacter sp. TaxID=114847 RepID=UPI002635549C|nr:hypothetical protein [uncultured Roseobacter sp.]